MTLQLWPAVDVAEGRAAQVVSPTLSDDPAAAIDRWVGAGARGIHLVDLDRARGSGDQLGLLALLVRDCPVPVQLSGGLVPGAALEEAASTGAARVTLASTAWRRPEEVRAALRRHGERLGVALDIDVTTRMVTARGAGGDLGSLDDLLQEVRGWEPARWVITDTAKDGARSGPALELLAELGRALPGTLVASGGVNDLEDLADLLALRRAGAPLEGVIIGAALHHGSLDLSQALALVDQEGAA